MAWYSCKKGYFIKICILTPSSVGIYLNINVVTVVCNCCLCFSLEQVPSCSVAHWIRIGITFYPITFDKTTGSKQVHYWQALINVIDVIDKGKGYAKGSEFVLTWPPIRDKTVEDPETTPYYS